MEGYVKIYRKLKTDPAYVNSTPAQFKVLMNVLLSITWKPYKWDSLGYEFVIQPGEVFTSERQIAEEAGNGVTRDVVHKALERFRKLGFWTLQKTHRGVLIHVINWEKYQQQPETDTTRDTSETPARHQRDTSETPAIKEEDKKIRSIRSIKKDKKENINEEIKTFCQGNKKLEQALNDFMEVRKGLKAPNTLRAIHLCMNSLKKLAGNDQDKMIDLVNQSIVNGWKGIFPIKKYNRNYNNRYVDSRDHNYSREVEDIPF